MDFSQEQLSIAQTIWNVGRRMGASIRQIASAFQAAWVESRLRNLPYGDRDSLGVFQQRPSQGWGSPAQILNPEYAAEKYFAEAIRIDNGSGTTGQLAQRVQRSAFPDRYDEQAAKPLSLLNQIMGGGLDLSGLGVYANDAMTGGFGLSAWNRLVNNFFALGAPKPSSSERFQPFLGQGTISGSQRFNIAIAIALVVIIFAWRELG